MMSVLQIVGGLCLLAVVYSQTNPIVDTDLGKISGFVLKSVKDNNDIYAFTGIRYAQAPINEKRFRAPVPVEKWDNVLDATNDITYCPQPAPDTTWFSEDCLMLNVYSRNLNAKNPVLVFIHGGANFAGSSHRIYDHGPDYLMDSENEIVLVTLNYRLGALGFLTTRTSDAPGNYGYLDQVLVLQWVQNHISKFGGDPNSVTIAGTSAGSMAVTLHLVSPLSKGLFHAAIAMSGSTTTHHDHDNLHWATEMAKGAGCPMYNPPDLISCLRDVPWQTLITIPQTWDGNQFGGMKFNHEVDGYFLTDHPSNLIATGNFNQVPIMAGITTMEFSYVPYAQETNTRMYNDMYLNLDKYGPQMFVYKPESTTDDIDRKLKKLYLGDKTINEQPLENFGAMYSDSFISSGIHRLVSLARKYVDVYYYRFDYAGRYGSMKDKENKPRGVSHGDDIQYLFRNGWFEKQIELTDPERFMVDRMVAYFTSFAKNKVPQTNDGVEWLPSDKDSVRNLYIDKESTLGEEPYTDRYELWDSMFPLPLSSSSSSAGYATGLLTLAVLIMSHLFKYILY